MNAKLPTLRIHRGTGETARKITLESVTGDGAYLARTDVRVTWTDTNLIVRFTCEDTDIWGTHTARDAPLYEEEVVEVFLCPSGDLRRYFELEVSPRNVVFDATVFSPDLDRLTMTVDTGWDCEGLRTVVEASGPVHKTPPLDRVAGRGSWDVELAIPFAGLGVEPPRAGDVWRGNFYRIDRPANPSHAEFQAWSPTLERPANFHVPARFGQMVFVG